MLYDYLMFAGFFIADIALLVFGVRAYLGRYRSWARYYAYMRQPGFASLYWGIGFGLLIVVGVVRKTYGISMEPMFKVALVMLMFGTFSLVWLPKFMLPEWYVEERAEYNQQEKLYRENQKNICNSIKQRKRFFK